MLQTTWQNRDIDDKTPILRAVKVDTLSIYTQPYQNIGFRANRRGYTLSMSLFEDHISQLSLTEKYEESNATQSFKNPCDHVTLRVSKKPKRLYYPLNTLRLSYKSNYAPSSNK